MPLAIALPRRTARLVRPIAAALFGVALLLGPLVGSASAAVGLDARILLQGHTRVGSWMAIEVEFTNDGPAIQGELRLAGGSQGRTRFSVAVDLPTDSRKVYVLHAQPPAFGRSVKIELVSGSDTIASADVAYLVHDSGQLVVGVLAERPQGIIGELDLDPSPNGAPAAIVSLGIRDLPERVEGWATLDRLIWQDVDSNNLTDLQVAALRGWIAAGGELVIAGGTAGIGTLSGFPDDLIPYRPTATVDIAPESISGLVGAIPADATDLPALAGPLGAGRALATSGDRVVAAELDYGSGSVTILGFDPTVAWLAAGNEVEGMWRRFLPNRTAGGPVISADDSQIVSAVGQLASLALPPIGGLIGILGGYILLIGPINYFVLRRIDRRELAWITMPVLIVVFAVGAYGFGTALRGSDLIVNEVAIVRGAPGATEGTAQVYLGVFSPSRSTYQVEIPGGALLASPISGDFTIGGTAATLDVVQGDPSLVRNLAVGFGSLRTIRAESATTVPLIQTQLSLVDGVLTGTIRNESDQNLEKVAVVLGGSVAVVGDIGPGEEKTVSLRPSGNPFFQSLSDRIFGQVFFGDASQLTDDGLRIRVRHAIIDQLTYDPMWGNVGTLNASNPVVLAWGRSEVLDVRIENQTARHNANVLYYYPTDLTVEGTSTFASDLIHSSVVSADAAFFSKDPFSLNMGAGTATIAYQPIAFDGAITATELQLALNFGGAAFPSPTAVELEPLEVVPVRCTDATNQVPPGCQPPHLDGIPEVELFDRVSGLWARLPHMGNGSAYTIEAPGRYVDAATGQVLVRFVNDQLDSGVGFQFSVAISGEIE
ncbi:MAG TPA: hypothetical protein VFX65_00090 [Candidatus Limnocylindrales bacterium]|nr:hypothetical protein [Candidatus Limnocylindrales bacterium]